MRRSFTLRVRVISALLLLGALFLVFRLYYVQILKGEDYRRKAESQYIGRAGPEEERSDIFFSGKSGEPFAAALTESGYRIVMNPSILADAEGAYTALSGIIPLDRDRFFASAAKKGDAYEEIASRVPEDAALIVSKEAIIGITAESEKWRLYPRKELAAHVLGFVGWKGDERVGRYGLERYWEHALRAESDGLAVNFFAEIFSNLGTLAGASNGEERGDIVTSVEPVVEQRLEEILERVGKQYDSRITGGIVIDPRDGSVLALAAHPSFDPNTFNTISDPGVFSNPVVESVFEFGSIMKPLTMASGIDSGAVTRESTYNDTGCITRDDAKVCNYDGKARGVVSMQEVLSQSLNTGAAFVAEQTGKERFAAYMIGLGLGEETGIDLPGEVPGIISALRSGSALDLASASFGQGVAVTPIAMARALAALANHGVAVTPHVSDYIRLSTGGKYKTWAEDERRVFRAESADAVTDMLVTVVDNALLEGKIRLEHHSIAAKTGTAQMARKGGGYYTDRYLHSFFGYFPARDPRFLVFLFTVEPHGVTYASQTLAEPFGELAKFLISYYDIPPDR